MAIPGERYSNRGEFAFHFAIRSRSIEDTLSDSDHRVDRSFQSHNQSTACVKLVMSSASSHSISIVVPMFNESELAAKNVARLQKVMDGLAGKTELIVVNDGSSDNTLTQVEGLASEDPRIRVHSYQHNRGRGFAIRAGIERASGEIIVVTEGDLSYGDDIVERLASQLLDGEYDCVVASPHTRGGGMKNVPMRRAFFTLVGNWILTRLMPVKLGTYTGMTRSYRRDAIQAMYLESDGKELHLEIISKLVALGYRVGELPATLQWPEGRKTRKGTFAPWKIIVSHLGFGFGEAPLLLLGSAGGLLILFGLLLGCYLLLVSLSGNPVGGRPAVVFSPSCILVGFFMILIGLLAQQNKQLQRQLHRIQTQLAKLDRNASTRQSSSD